MKKIIVIGAGPAGVVSAIGLKKLNFDVTLISKKRPFNAIEGFSFRTLQGLQRASCNNALQTIGEYLPRCVTWNNESYQNNYEYIVHREKFDEALLIDAKEKNIEVIEASAKIIDEQKIKVSVNNKILEADFIVDARGRFAKRKTQKKSKPTSAFLIKYKKRSHKLQTSLETSKYGWIWKAQDKDNLNYLQLTSDSKMGRIYIKKLIKDENLNIKNPKLTIREASSYLSKDKLKENYIRIGDAACAVDPLSGNGVFQALSTALISPFVINTLLNGNKEDKKAAYFFYNQRVEDIFYRYTRMGREFYEKEKSYKTKFWSDRSIWPDYKDSHKMIKKPYIEKRAILVSPFIKSHEVVITKNHPLGVWKLGDIDLVKIIKKLLSEKKQDHNSILKTFKLNKTQMNHLVPWLKENL